MDREDDEVMANAAQDDHRSDDGNASPRATPSHASSGTHDEEPHCGREASLDTEAGSHVSRAAPTGPAAHNLQEADDEEEQQLGLELTLGFAPVATAPTPACVTQPATPAVDATDPGVVGFRFL